MDASGTRREWERNSDDVGACEAWLEPRCERMRLGEISLVAPSKDTGSVVYEAGCIHHTS